MSSAGSPARDNMHAQLARLTKRHKPARAPFYVQHATMECPMTGWWWQPAGADKPEPLGASFVLAVGAIAVLPPPAPAGHGSPA